MQAEEARGDNECMICSSHAETLHLWCGHMICIPCGKKAHDFGHRHCPVCRVPHLLHAEQLRSNAWQLRQGYNNWRRGKACGNAGDASDVSGFNGWRLARSVDFGDLPPDEDDWEMYNARAGFLWMFSNVRALQAKLSELQHKLKVVRLEHKLAALKDDLRKVREMKSLNVRWADPDADQGRCLAEAVGTPRASGGIRVPPLHIRPLRRRHIHGTECPPSKLSPAQIAYRCSLVGQQVRVVEGPDFNLRGRLISVSPRGYATIVTPAPGEARPLPARVTADPRARFAGYPRCIHSYAIEPHPTSLPLPVAARGKPRVSGVESGGKDGSHSWV